jgi:integrase
MLIGIRTQKAECLIKSSIYKESILLLMTIPAHPINEYIQHFNRHSTGLHNRSAIRMFLRHVYKIPPNIKDRKVSEEEALQLEELCKEYLSDKERNHLKDLNDYFSRYGGRTSSMKGYFSILKTFLHYYEVELKDRDIKDIQRNMPKRNATTRFEDFDMELAKNLLMHANTLQRAVILTGIASGARISEICRLTLDDITPVVGTNIYMVYISEASKNGRDRWTFITDECWRQIQAFLVERDSYLANKRRIPDKDEVKRRQNKEELKKLKEAGKKLPVIDNGAIFPFSPNTFEKMFVNLLIKCKLYELDKNTGKATIRFHQTRNLFRTSLILQGAKEPVIERYLHFDNKSSYNNYSKKQLAEEYSKYCSALVTNFSQELKENNDKLEDLTYRLELQLKKKDSENKELTDNMIKLIPVMLKLVTQDNKSLTPKELEDRLNNLF